MPCSHAACLTTLNLQHGSYYPASALSHSQLSTTAEHTYDCRGGCMQGSGVATSAGMAFTTLGSDTGGSIRFPAAACGTVGLKPTWGRVSRHGVLDLGQTLDHVGPLCRCTADAAITLQVIAGQDKNDPTSLPLPPPSLFTEGSDWAMLLDLPADRKPLRIGVDASYNTEGVDPELSVAVGAAIAKLAKATGATIVPCSMPKDLMKYCEAWQTLCAPEAAHAHRAAGTWPSRKDDYGSSFRDYLERGDSLSAVEYADARILREQCVGELNTMFAGHTISVMHGSHHRRRCAHHICRSISVMHGS